MGHALGLLSRPRGRSRKPCTGSGWSRSEKVTAQDTGSEIQLPAVARALVRDLGCAVLAMRYPVGDEFAIKLGQKLYEGMFDDELPLTRALQLALPEVIDSPLAVATPALFGRPRWT